MKIKLNKMSFYDFTYLEALILTELLCLKCLAQNIQYENVANDVLFVLRKSSYNK